MSPSNEPDLSERIAVFRHGLISRLLPDDLSADERRKEMRRIVEAEHIIPGTTRTHIAEGTLRDWMRAWRAGGFNALKPKPRIDDGSTRRLEPVVAERLLELKEADPHRSIRECIELVRREPIVTDTMCLSHSTVHRLFQRHELTRSNIERSDRGVDRRRFAFREAGQLWMSDVMHGPSVIGDSDARRRRKTYLIAFLDDATRVIPHAEFTFSESTKNFLPVMKQALLRRGLPERLYVDNGANYRSHHLSLVCAKLGIALIHAKPRSPQGKGKIERFFRTVRAQLIARLVPEDTTSLEALNRRLGAWVEGEYHRRPHRGLEGDTPLDRWSATAANVRYPDPDVGIDEMFLFEAKRKVQSDRTVSLDGRLYEVDASLIGEKVSLRFDPARPEGTVTVLHEGKRIEQARRVDPYANCFVKRHPHNGTPQTDEAPQDPPTGLAMRDLGSLSGNTTHDEHDDSDKDVAGGER